MTERHESEHKPPFARKLNKSEIEASIYQCLAFDEDDNAEDYTMYEDSIEEDTYILVNCITAKILI